MDKDVLQKRIDALPQTDNKKEPHVLAARKNNPRSYMTWDFDEDKLLVELILEKMPLSEIARWLKRSQSAIETRIDLLATPPSTPKKEPITKQKMPAPCEEKDETRRVIRYWRNCLADADKMGFDANKMKEAKQFPVAHFQKGQLPSEDIESFFEDAEKRAREKKKNANKKKYVEEEDVFIEALQVVVTPTMAIKTYTHGKTTPGPSEVYLVWMNATLHRDGRLSPPQEMVPPWIERRCLTPNVENQMMVGHPLIGDVSDVDELYAHLAPALDNDDVSWEQLFSFASHLFETMTLKKPSALTDYGYCLSEFGAILPNNGISEPSKNIIATYDQVLSIKKEMPALLKQFCSLEDRVHDSDQALETLFLASIQHVGQMQNEHPLAASQRLSMSYFSDPKHNDIFTIHGPPGTGKTTLLLSIIASQWIEAALQKKPAPIQVAVSTNNLAVTNILDHLNKASEKLVRWLPDFNTYGLYLAPFAQAKEAEKKNYLYRCSYQGEDTTKKFYTPEYRKEATAYFLEKFKQTYREAVDLKKCQAVLHEELLFKKTLLDGAIQFAYDFYELEQIFVALYGSMDNIRALLFENHCKNVVLQSYTKVLDTLETQWLLHKTTKLKWFFLLSWLPFVKPLLIDRITLFARSHELPQKITCVTEIEKIIAEKRHATILQHQTLEEERARLEAAEKKHQELLDKKGKFEEVLGFEINIDNLFDFSDSTNILCKLDKTVRYDLFVLATHYWEATWLLSSPEVDTLYSTRLHRERSWQIQAMLTPCFVTTLQSGPSFFQCKEGSEFEIMDRVVDLLIVDEAGQVLPALAGGMIVTAKKLLMVGDTKQIEPICALTEGMDRANAKKFGLCTNNDDYEALKTKGILCSSNPSTGGSNGNLVVIGQRHSKFHLANEKEPGLLLKEHRRCAAEIISYCNELCYDNQLIPMTREENSNYPRMGYAHIKGHEERIGGSRCNPTEAMAIVEWIHKHHDNIVAMCNNGREPDNLLSLDDCIGIVTPFAAQRMTIKSALSHRKLYIDKVGTVHSLQGAEKPIIIFSPVYIASENQGKFFFDLAANMLNVAVSRAQRSFLVFGDMDIFDASHTRTPSAMLAKHLFKKEDNEIFDVAQPAPKRIQVDRLRQITTLEEHRNVLKESFAQAHHTLSIVSPFLKTHAIKSDGIPQLIAEHAERIEILIYTDPNLNHGDREEFKRAQQLLEAAGAKVFSVKNVHSKIIAVDDRMMIQGSFNWFSAVRNEVNRLEETSLIYTGENVAEFIREAMEPIIRKIDFTLSSKVYSERDCAEHS